jgi:CRISPR/Cas system Type II protein with McrA/HNH and RuvC-like nuclease domain
LNPKNNKPIWLKNIRQLIHWHYAKLMTESIFGTRIEFARVMIEFKKLESNEKNMSELLRQNKQMLDMEKKCAYCNSDKDIQLDHIIPLSKGGWDIFDNLVFACKKCNLSKSNKSLIEWYGEDYSNKIPKFVFAKYLKLVYKAHEQNGSLDNEDFNGDGILDYRDLDDVFENNIQKKTAK